MARSRPSYMANLSMHLEIILCKWVFYGWILRYLTNCINLVRWNIYSNPSFLIGQTINATVIRSTGVDGKIENFFIIEVLYLPKQKA